MVGVCAGPHKKWKQMSVVLFSGPAGKNDKTHDAEEAKKKQNEVKTTDKHETKF